MTRCLVTGATGYIGGRLAPRLAQEGYDVRVASRDPGKLRDIAWVRRVESVAADVTDAASLAAAMRGVDVAYFLVHSMTGGADFAELDRRAARNFASAAADAGVGRLVYLGGLRPPHGDALSPHLHSRNEVGDILLASGVPTAALQAATILGSGSASFEMLRYLTERLPAMVTPRWVASRLQPISVRDVLRYLCGVIDLPAEVNRTFDIGGPDVLTYAELMQRYAQAAGLRARVLVPVPVLTPRLSSYWVNLVTPIPGALAQPLIESLRYEMVCQEHDIADHVPDPDAGLIDVDEALGLALQRIRDADVETRWSSAAWPFARLHDDDPHRSAALVDSGPMPTDPSWAGGSRYVDERETPVDADAQTLWEVIESIGGDNGWYSFPLLWRVRGVLDRLVGGAGLRRGRRDQRRLAIGESLDWWRVEDIDRPSLLRLRAEMRLPGEAWLELSVLPSSSGTGTRYRQRAVYVPRGLLGHLYWWVITPFHGFVFGAMVRNIRVAAESRPQQREWTGATQPAGTPADHADRHVG
jgi:uncharacterized protein YbjT (DUF2867 family)